MSFQLSGAADLDHRATIDVTQEGSLVWVVIESSGREDIYLTPDQAGQLAKALESTARDCAAYIG